MPCGSMSAFEKTSLSEPSLGDRWLTCSHATETSSATVAMGGFRSKVSICFR